MTRLKSGRYYCPGMRNVQFRLRSAVLKRCVLKLLNVPTWAQAFKQWIAVSAGSIAIQWTSHSETICVIQWAVMPMVSDANGHANANGHYPPFEQLGPEVYWRLRQRLPLYLNIKIQK